MLRFGRYPFRGRFGFGFGRGGGVLVGKALKSGNLALEVLDPLVNTVQNLRRRS